jgi:Na+-translocating ferredoxin:NAD+ oxidoreductase RnfA subunit
MKLYILVSKEHEYTNIQNFVMKIRGIAQVVEFLLRKCEAPGSTHKHKIVMNS